MKDSKHNVVCRLQKWMDSETGQTFLNYAYSWGAAIVILGTLFKLTHMPSANFWLFLGMGTEVAVFFISAFDRPFDKTKETERKEEDRQTYGRTTVTAATAQQTGRRTDIYDAIHDVYRQQLLKLHAQLKDIDHMNEQLRIQNAYMGEINKVYARMIEAVGGRTAVLRENEDRDYSRQR